MVDEFERESPIPELSVTKEVEMDQEHDNAQKSYEVNDAPESLFVFSRVGHTVDIIVSDLSASSSASV